MSKQEEKHVFKELSAGSSGWEVSRESLQEAVCAAKAYPVLLRVVMRQYS